MKILCPTFLALAAVVEVSSGANRQYTLTKGDFELRVEEEHFPLPEYVVIPGFTNLLPGSVSREFFKDGNQVELRIALVSNGQVQVRAERYTARSVFSEDGNLVEDFYVVRSSLVCVLTDLVLGIVSLSSNDKGESSWYHLNRSSWDRLHRAQESGGGSYFPIGRNPPLIPKMVQLDEAEGFGVEATLIEHPRKPTLQFYLKSDFVAIPEDRWTKPWPKAEAPSSSFPLRSAPLSASAKRTIVRYILIGVVVLLSTLLLLYLVRRFNPGRNGGECS